MPVCVTRHRSPRSPPNITTYHYKSGASAAHHLLLPGVLNTYIRISTSTFNTSETLHPTTPGQIFLHESLLLDDLSCRSLTTLDADRVFSDRVVAGFPLFLRSPNNLFLHTSCCTPSRRWRSVLRPSLPQSWLGCYRFIITIINVVVVPHVLTVESYDGNFKIH